MDHKEEFNISNWRFRYLLKENGDMIASQAKKDIEEQPIDEVENNENLVDEIGDFWIVTKPTTKEVLEDILNETNIFSFALSIKGGLDMKSVIGVYLKRGDASRAAKEAIKQRDMNLKEMEGAMNDYRETKKSIDDKRNKAAEIIKSLK